MLFGTEAAIDLLHTQFCKANYHAGPIFSLQEIMVKAYRISPKLGSCKFAKFGIFFCFSVIVE